MILALAAASRIVVPKGGSVPFVIFVPIKPLEQACWLQPGYDPRADVYPATACDAVGSPTSFAHLHGIWPTHAKEDREKKYKDWTPDEVTALEKHAFAVVAGMHIQGVGAQGAAARAITCASADAAIRVAYLKGNPLTCVLTGADLSALKTLRLTPADGSDVTKTIDVPLTSTGDSTTESFTLSVDQLKTLAASTYSLSGLDSTGKSTDLKLNFSILPLPTLDPIVPSTFTAVSLNNKAATLNLTGTNLTQVTQLKLALDADTFIIAPVMSVESKKLVATLPKMSPPTGTYHVLLVLDPSAQVVVDSKQTITIN